MSEPKNEPKPVVKKSKEIHPFRAVIKFLYELIDLREGIDVEGTIYEIRNNNRMKGANAWMLMCSIMIASLGLDLNSPAIIIGAMLISPLMSPILGIGLGIGTYDVETISVSVRHFLIAIAIALITSTLYFTFTPLGNVNEQILSRTAPTLLDVLVAFFGGVAGIISSSRKDKSNAIPGVAIATALMPPLCVTGFGIATGNPIFIFNSFYLFFLNSFFVALSTYLIVRFLRFPIFRIMEAAKRRRMLLLVAFVSLLMTVPSVIILRTVYYEAVTQRKIGVFIDNYFGDRRKYIDNWSFFPSDTLNQLVIKVYGTEINRNDIRSGQKLMKESGILNTDLEIIQTTEINLDHIKTLEAEIKGIVGIQDQLVETRKMRSEQDYRIDSLISEINAIRGDTIDFQSIVKESKILFPDLEYFAIAKAQESDYQSIKPDQPIIICKWKTGLSSLLRREYDVRLKSFIAVRTNLPDIKLVETN